MFGDILSTLFIELIGALEKMSPKSGSTKFSVISSTSLLYPWNCSKRWTSEEFFFIAKSFDCLPKFSDFDCNSCVWLEQSTKIWAMVGNTIILGILVPFEWGMTLNTGRVLCEIGSNRSNTCAKNLKNLNWRQRTIFGNKHVMSVWSCVSGHFTGLRHWDCVEMVHMLTWFDWCCFYYFVRNSLVALLEALCARWVHVFSVTRAHTF